MERCVLRGVVISYCKAPFVEDPLVDGEILHSGEGGDVERWLEPRIKSFLFAIAILSLFHLLVHHSFNFVDQYSSQQEIN